MTMTENNNGTRLGGREISESRLAMARQALDQMTTLVAPESHLLSQKDSITSQLKGNVADNSFGKSEMVRLIETIDMLW